MLEDMTVSRVFIFSLSVPSTSLSASFVSAFSSLRFSSSAEDPSQTPISHSEVPSAFFMCSQSGSLMQILSVTQSAHTSPATQPGPSTPSHHHDLRSASETMQMTEMMSEISSIKSVLSSFSRTRKISTISELSDDEIISIEKHEKDVIYKNDQAAETVKNTK